MRPCRFVTVKDNFSNVETVLLMLLSKTSTSYKCGTRPCIFVYTYVHEFMTNMNNCLIISRIFNRFSTHLITQILFWKVYNLKIFLYKSWN